MNPRPKLPYKQETEGSSPTTTAGGTVQLVSRLDLLPRSASPKAAATSFLSGSSPDSAGLKSLSSIMPSSSKNKRKNKTKKRPVENVAALYKEDLGTEGLKSTGMSSSSSSSHQDIQSFHVKVDKKEKSKRKRRMVRLSYDAEIGHFIVFRILIGNFFASFIIYRSVLGNRIKH